MNRRKLTRHGQVRYADNVTSPSYCETKVRYSGREDRMRRKSRKETRISLCRGPFFFIIIIVPDSSRGAVEENEGWRSP